MRKVLPAQAVGKRPSSLRSDGWEFLAALGTSSLSLRRVLAALGRVEFA